jgi:hypothetical protein
MIQSATARAASSGSMTCCLMCQAISYSSVAPWTSYGHGSIAGNLTSRPWPVFSPVPARAPSIAPKILSSSPTLIFSAFSLACNRMKEGRSTRFVAAIRASAWLSKGAPGSVPASATKASASSELNGVGSAAAATPAVGAVRRHTTPNGLWCRGASRRLFVLLHDYSL